MNDIDLMLLARQHKILMEAGNHASANKLLQNSGLTLPVTVQVLEFGKQTLHELQKAR